MEYRVNPLRTLVFSLPREGASYSEGIPESLRDSVNPTGLAGFTRCLACLERLGSAWRISCSPKANRGIPCRNAPYPVIRAVGEGPQETSSEVSPAEATLGSQHPSRILRDSTAFLGFDDKSQESGPEEARRSVRITGPDALKGTRRRPPTPVHTRYPPLPVRTPALPTPVRTPDPQPTHGTGIPESLHTDPWTH